MIQAQNICLSFGNQIIFDHISFILQPNQRVGLVGANGSGKSTLLKAITHHQLLDNGIITVANNLKVAYMPQEVVLLSQKSVFDEAFSSFATLIAAQEISAQLEDIMLHNPTAEQIAAYAKAQEQLTQLNPASARAQTGAMLQGLGFSQERQQSPVSSLSVGWKMRVVLAKLLLQKADFYLFDEPTNHLDIVAKDWFIQFLKQSSFGFMLVCHERYFLDQVCTHILELERGKGTMYRGNYSAYIQQKEQALIAQEAAYTQQQREIAQKRETIEKFRYKPSKAKMVQSMIKQLEALPKIPQPISPLKKVHFSFGAAVRAGKIVLKVEHCGFSFGDKKIFSNVSFEIQRGEKVALIAPNGMGKTTLFNVIAGIYTRQTGNIELGHKVTPALFAQDQDAVLNPRITIFDHMQHTCSKKTDAEIRSFLGAFLFSNEDIHKKLGVLSGGEKNRVSMAAVLMQQANFLLLDEPTNHLDMASKDVLLQALQQFDGTILFVSHDHDFINHLANRILELTPTGIVSYPGTYSEYLQYKKEKALGNESPKTIGTNDTKIVSTQSAPAVKQGASAQKNPNINEFEVKKQIKKLEQMIEKTEKAIAQTEHCFAEIKYGSSEFKDLQEKLKTLKQNLEQYVHEWEKLLADLEKK